MINIMDMLIKLKGCCEHEENKIRSSLGLKPSEYRTLALMKDETGYSNDELSEETGLSKSRGSRVFDTLVKKKYLLRHVNQDDKRSFIYELSEEGTQIKIKINRLKSSCEEKILLRIKKQEEDIIRKGLGLLLSIMEGKGT